MTTAIMANAPAFTPRPAGRRFRRLLASAICLVLMLAMPGSLRAEVLLERAVVVTGEWAPFTSEYMEDDGLLTALVTEVLRGMDRAPEYEFLPFSVALDKAAEGKAIGTFPWFSNAERAERFVYSEPIIGVEYVIFVNPASPAASATTFEDLKGLKTARVEGYAYGKFDCFLDYGDAACPPEPKPPKRKSEPEVVPAASEFLAFQMLAKGKIDYVAASRAVGKSLIRRAFSLDDQPKFRILDAPELRWPINVHFLFSKNRADAKDLKQAFDKALAEVKASGRVAALRQRLDWEEHWRRNLVVLGDPSGGGLITGHPQLGDSEFVVLPRGTRGVVLRWSSHFRGTAAAADDPAMSYIQLVNGPLRGTRLWVRDELISLVGE